MIIIIIPVFNEIATLPDFHRRFTNTIWETGEPYEIIMVNDGGNDNSLDVMRNINRSVPSVKIRPFMHSWAPDCICSSLDYASGDIVVIMNFDLQDPLNINEL